MTNQDSLEGFDAAAEKKELVKKLFWIYQNGNLESYLRITARQITRLLVQDGKACGNVFDITEIIRGLAWLRDLASRATPKGETLAFTRDEIDAYSRSEWGEPMDWNLFFGLDKETGPEE